MSSFIAQSLAYFPFISRCSPVTQGEVDAFAARSHCLLTERPSPPSLSIHPSYNTIMSTNTSPGTTSTVKTQDPPKEKREELWPECTYFRVTRSQTRPNAVQYQRQSGPRERRRFVKSKLPGPPKGLALVATKAKRLTTLSPKSQITQIRRLQSPRMPLRMPQGIVPPYSLATKRTSRPGFC
jgi:hypothetical protein